MSFFDDDGNGINVDNDDEAREYGYYSDREPPTAEKTLPQNRYPWRRYFARSIDTGIYGSAWSAAAAVFFKVDLLDNTDFKAILDLAVVIVMTLLLEPLFISLFKTTPGKAIFGIKITAKDGRKLTYSEALDRTWGLFTKGMGYNIPVYSLVCSWRSYKACKLGKNMPWDEELSFTLKDTRGWRAAVCVLAVAALAATDVTVAMSRYLPPNRGEITIAEFAENYNYYARYFGMEQSGMSMDSKGRWVDSATQDENFIVMGTEFLPELEFELEDGHVQSVSFFYELENQDKHIDGITNKLTLLTFSLVGAQKEIGPFSNAFTQMVNEIDRPVGQNNFPSGDFDFIEAGVQARCVVEAEGYDAITGRPSEENREDNYFCMEFSLTK